MKPCKPSHYKPTSAGYGQICVQGKMQLHHRVAYCEANGLRLEDIAGLVVRHDCDNPICIEPEHLRTGTQSDNMQDCVRRGRHARVGSKGESHPGVKLTDVEVCQIRSMYTGTRGELTALGKRFGVDRTTIANIVYHRQRTETK